jgi:hypothetical protein
MRNLLVLALLGAAAAQETPKYTNPEMGLEFDGVYGWERKEPPGSGAWTELVAYRNEAFDADVRLLVRPSPHASTHDLKQALEKEFQSGGEPAPGKPVYKEATFRDAQMRGGNALPAIEVEAVQLRIAEDGKKREYQYVVRTFLGANRLFRVSCEAPRARAKRVRDLFDLAVAGLVVTATDEKVQVGISFRSERGNYSCPILETFEPVLPAEGRKMDSIFESRRLGVGITVYSYEYKGDSRDHLDELADHYGADFQAAAEGSEFLGGDSFAGTLTRDKEVTLLAGTVRDGRLYRIHTKAAAEKAAAAAKAHQEFLKRFKVGN